jgi:hypothetical protein
MEEARRDAGARTHRVIGTASSRPKLELERVTVVRDPS